jgi:hypothetical protein
MNGSSRAGPGIGATPPDPTPRPSNTKPDGSDNPKGRAKNRRVTITFTAANP